MAKDVNIHVKTTGTAEARQQLESVGHATEEMGAKTSRAGGWMKEAFSALVGPLGIAGLVTLAVAGIRKIIAAFDDMKKAASEAVHEMANQQRAAASFFEAFDAYSGPQRKAALAMARGVQAATGIPFEAAQQILEAQKRTFGAVTPESTQQFAAYWAMHGQNIGTTTDLIRWMGESKITTPERQGQIMRMISAVTQKTGLKDEELVAALTSQGEKFRYLGWTPEQTIENLGKALVPGEGTRGVQRLFGAIEGFTEEKARQLGAGPAVAADEARRLQWIRERPQLFQKAFGMAAPYITRLFAPAPPLEVPTAAEEQRKFAEYKETEEARLEMARGRGVQPTVSPEKLPEILMREHGKMYLEYLRINNPMKYQAIKNLGLSETAEQEIAARELWRESQPAEKPPGFFTKTIPALAVGGLIKRAYEKPPNFGELSPEERLAGVEKAAQTINIYNIGQIYNPRQGESFVGPRAAPENL